MNILQNKISEVYKNKDTLANDVPLLTLFMKTSLELFLHTSHKLKPKQKQKKAYSNGVHTFSKCVLCNVVYLTDFDVPSPQTQIYCCIC